MDNGTTRNKYQHLVAPTITTLISVVMLIAIAAFIPITPDEISRSSDAIKFTEGGVFNFYWPPLLIFLGALCKTFSLNYLETRLVYLAIESIIIFILATYAKGIKKIIFVFLLPYFGLVLAIASPQGLMIALLGLLIFSVKKQAWLPSTLVTALLYIVNPICILILPAACFFYYIRSNDGPKIFYTSLVAYAILFPLIAKIYVDTGQVLPTFSANGAINLYLGNNPSEYSFRGAWSPDDLATLQKGNAIDFNTRVHAYLTHDPLSFGLNIVKKLAFYLAPFDFIRSDMGGRYSILIYFYIGIAQILIYTFFYNSYKNAKQKSVHFLAWLLFLGAWIAYSMFFVKIRFRIPFDFVLFMTFLTSSWSPDQLKLFNAGRIDKV